MVPLFNVQGHELQALDGDRSAFFEYLGPDLEGLSASDFERTAQNLERNLNQLEGELKLYKLGSRFFINSFGNVRGAAGTLIPCQDPISSFLGEQSAELNFYDNYLTQGNEFIRLLSFTDLPDRLHPLESSTFPDFVLCLKKYPSLTAKNRVNTKRKLHFQGLFKSMRDVDSEKAYQQAETILEQVVVEGAGLFRVECYLILRAPTKAELDQETTHWLAAFKAKDALLRVEERGLPHLYQRLIPGVPASFKRVLDVPSDYLAYLVPWHRDFVHEQGLSLRARSGEEVFVDIFHPTGLSFNVLITGTTGQGKSMLANKLLCQQLQEGAKAVVLDLGNSFHKNALYHGGTVLSQKINPLQFRNPAYLKEFILAAIDEKLGRKKEGKLYSCIEEALASTLVNSFEELLQFLEKDFAGISFYFAELLQFFTAETQPLSSFTYCDFGIYPEAMKAPLIIYLIELFKSLEGRKIFIFDECWHLLERNATYIEECFRTFRKHNASAVAISQTLDDFAESKIGRVIINTSYTKFLFRQEIRESEFIDANTKRLLETMQSRKGQYSEFLYKSEVGLKPLRYVPTALEYELYTSDPADTESFKTYMEEKGKVLPFRKAIENYTHIKHVKGTLQ